MIKLCEKCNERPRIRGGIICTICRDLIRLAAAQSGSPVGVSGPECRSLDGAARSRLYESVQEAIPDGDVGSVYQIHYDPPLEVLDTDPAARPVAVAVTCTRPDGTTTTRLLRDEAAA